MAISPSAQLKSAENIMLLQMHLDKQLRTGYLSLSSVRATPRGNILTFSPLTWPPTSQAFVTIGEGFNLIGCQNEDFLKLWSGGNKPIPDILEARSSFLAALQIALEIAKLKSSEKT